MSKFLTTSYRCSQNRKNGKIIQDDEVIIDLAEIAERDETQVFPMKRYDVEGVLLTRKTQKYLYTYFVVLETFADYVVWRLGFIE